MTASNHPLGASRRNVEQCCVLYREQVQRALDALNGAREELDVHTARKQLKQARATLRLLRPALSDRIYKHENAAARDAAKPLSGPRDAEVLIAALNELLDYFDATALRSEVKSAAEALERERSQGRGGLDAKTLSSIRRKLRNGVSRSAQWPIAGADWTCIEQGVSKAYRKAHRALRKARKEASTERLHEARKQVKYLWNQLHSMPEIAPRGLTKRLHKLSDLLGDDHDLAVLCTRLEERKWGLEDRTERTLRAFIEFRRQELQRDAFELGAKLFSDDPERFARKLDKRWRQAAQAETA